MPPSTSRLLSAGATLALTGAAGLGYAALVEPRSFVTRQVQVPCLPPGSPDLRLLQVSDLHLVPTQADKLAWIRSLAAWAPDLVVDTGDNLAHQDAVAPLLDALEGLLARPGVFVFGSNDYFAPVMKNPALYLAGPSNRKATWRHRLPVESLRGGLAEHWADLSNAQARLEIKGVRIAFAGLDDPHIHRDRLSTIPEAPTDVDLRMGVVHAPYLRALDAFAGQGYGLVLAGHTHGGQLCLPGRGALVTNCDLDPARAKGLHRHPTGSAPDQPSSSWLHVCAGAGASPYAPVRFCCRPEANLLTLTARRTTSASATDEAVV